MKSLFKSMVTWKDEGGPGGPPKSSGRVQGIPGIPSHRLFVTAVVLYLAAGLNCFIGPGAYSEADQWPTSTCW